MCKITCTNVRRLLVTFSPLCVVLVQFLLSACILPNFRSSCKGLSRPTITYTFRCVTGCFVIRYVYLVSNRVTVTSFNTKVIYIIILYVQVTVHRNKFRVKQPIRCIKYPIFILSQNSTCFSGIFCAHHQELSTVHLAIGTFHVGYVTAS